MFERGIVVCARLDVTQGAHDIGDGCCASGLKAGLVVGDVGLVLNGLLAELALELQDLHEEAEMLALPLPLKQSSHLLPGEARAEVVKIENEGAAGEEVGEDAGDHWEGWVERLIG